jgi:glycosyltransferase involved in cell wall biosynthesis
MKVLYLSKALVVGAYQTKMEALAAAGARLTAAVPPSWRDERGETWLEQAHTTGYDLHIVPMMFNGSFHTHFYPTLGTLLDRIRPDILHIDEEPYNAAAFHAGWLAHRRRIPFLFFTWQNIARTYPPPFRWMEQWNYRHAVHAIAGGEAAKNVLHEKGYRRPVTVIPQFGVDGRLFPFRERPAVSPVVIGYAGRFVEEKGLQVLLEAVAGLPPEGWRVVLRGSGPYENTLRSQAKTLGIEEKVTISPPLPSTAMQSFYHESDIFVLPSLTRSNWKEQFGRVLIEAMATGTVTVGSDSGEIPYVIGDSGVIVREGDIEALRAALRLLISDAPLRAKLARAGRERVLANFTQEAIAHHTIGVYEQILHTTNLKSS